MTYKDKSTRVGLIVTMSQDDTWPDSIVNRVKAYLPAVRKAIEGLGITVVDCGEIARTVQQMTAQGEQLRRENVHALVIYVGTWTYSNTAVMASLRTDVPVVVWANANIETFGIVGGSIVRGALEEVGVKNFMLYGDYTDPKVLQKLKNYCLGIAGATKLRGMIYGEGGGRSMGMYTARIDPSEWMSRFGIDVDSFDQVDAIRRAGKYPDAEARKFLAWMRKEFGGIEVKDEVMIAQIKLYFALREIIAEKGYDFMLHEGMLLEHSGPGLACIALATHTKQIIVLSLTVALFFPYGMAQDASPQALGLALAAFVAKLFVFAVFLGVIESSYAKMRFFRVPQFLGLGLLCAFLALSLRMLQP